MQKQRVIITKNAVQNEGSVSSGKQGSVCSEYPIRHHLAQYHYIYN